MSIQHNHYYLFLPEAELIDCNSVSVVCYKSLFTQVHIQYAAFLLVCTDVCFLMQRRS